MIAMISQPRYLPFGPYLRRMRSADVVVVLDTVQYSKRDWENRNRVRNTDGPVWLTVPVRGSHRVPISEIEVDVDQPWQQKHWRTLSLSYARAPHFEELADWLRPHYEREPPRLLRDLDRELTDAMLDRLGEPQPRRVLASELDADGTGTALLVSLCGAIGATGYLSGPEGRNYLDPDEFDAAGIELFVDDAGLGPYPQLHGEWIENLSAIDLMANVGSAAAGQLLAPLDVIPRGGRER